MTTRDYSYIGSGKIYLRELNGNSGLLEVGNASALSFSVSEEVKELKDYTQPGGGTANEVRRIDAVEVSMTLHELNPENFARAIYGNTSGVNAGAVSDEIHTAYLGGLVAFEFLPNATPAPVVVGGEGATTAATNTAYGLNALVVPAAPNGYFYQATVAGTSAGTAPTWPTTVGATVTDGAVTWKNMGATALTEGDDYEIRPGGVLILETADLADGAIIGVSYTKQAVDVVEAITDAGKEYEMIFDGLNEARSGKRTRVRVHRVKVGAATDLGLIGDEYAALEVTGKILKDASKTGAGVSQYFKVDIEQ